MLHRRFRILLSGFLLIGSLALTSCSTGSESELSNVYSQFARAVEGGRGHQASELISKQSEAHYAKLRDYALEGSRYGSRLTLYDEISVYYLRARYDRRALVKFTGRDIFAILVENGLAGVPDMDDFMLRDVNISAESASAKLATNDPGANYRIGFALEKRNWRVNDAMLRQTRDEVLAFRMVSYKGSREDVIDEILKSVGVREGFSRRLMDPVDR